MYPDSSAGYRRRFGGDWRQGGTAWTIDYPRGDRHVAEMVRRLTRIDARSVEQPVNLDDGDDVFNWPWLYAVEVGHWELTDAQAAKLREYLLRGGFLMVDDFHGTCEWSRVHREHAPRLPGPARSSTFRTTIRSSTSTGDLSTASRSRAPNFSQTGRTYEQDGVVPHWRAIYDDKGRIMVAICHDMDLGDSVEHADTPQYPEKYSTVGMRCSSTTSCTR